MIFVQLSGFTSFTAPPSVRLSCCKDNDAIALYLLSEERPQIVVVSNQIDTTTQQLFKILGSQNVIEHLWWHGDKQIYITTLSLLPSCNRTKKAHASDSESLLQLGLMSTDKVDVFLQSPHITTNNVFSACKYTECF